MNKKEKTTSEKGSAEGKGMSRREALRKMSYAAFAASTLFLLLNNPTKVYAQSETDPGDPGDDWDWE